MKQPTGLYASFPNMPTLAGLLAAIALFLLAMPVTANEGDEEPEETSIFSPAPIIYDAPSPLLTNIPNRNIRSLNGNWNVVIDKLGLGERGIFGSGYYHNARQQSGMELIEYSFDERLQLKVPGDWNSQQERLFFYDGSVWYQRTFTAQSRRGERYFLHFGGANFTTTVYLNGSALGQHKGGYTPFDFEVTERLKDGDNDLVVRVDNTLDQSSVPTMRTDWWQYGGITRDANLVTVPDTFVRQFHVWLAEPGSSDIRGWALVEGAAAGTGVTLTIDELNVSATASTDASGRAEFRVSANPRLWSPDDPFLYDVSVSVEDDTSTDRVGFRTVRREGGQILLNGKPIFLRGISMHEETVLGEGVATARADAEASFALARQLGANFVRLAHYPHNEHTVRLADELGLMLWSEIPVYWAIDWRNEETQQLANNMMSGMVQRDLNRAAVVIWSLGNETPVSEARTAFMASEAATVRALDHSGRLLAAALIGNPESELREVAGDVMVALLKDADVSLQDKAKLVVFIGRELVDSMLADEKPGADTGATTGEANPAAADADQILIELDDPLGDIVDVVGYNEYFGWYYSAAFAANLPASEADIRRVVLNDIMPRLRFSNSYGKPMVISEFGAGAKAGFRSPEALLWSEEYQARVYEAQLDMLQHSPLVQGMSPWVLKDFRAALRPLNGIQEFYNRKGLVDERGNRKLAFDVLGRFYRSLPQQ
ncbi:MAG: glycoside hydrolase family 2 TIM barrel-domain containing protein [Halieaceae bacterium]|jgi:beta-glucuronidase|nr:glycoside hydrolase family 2 TIM barrel-domain containing protein [Halieaceae bacterium]